MVTHENPPESLAATALGLTEGDKLSLSLASGDSLFGSVIDVKHEPSGKHLEAPGRCALRFEDNGIEFQLVVHYRQPDSTPHATSADLRLVERTDWSIPITPGIEYLARR